MNCPDLLFDKLSKLSPYFPARHGLNNIAPLKRWKKHFMKTVFRLIRWPLGQIVILVDWLTRPKIPQFPPDQREELDEITSSMKIYHFKQCPFCVKTRRTVRRLGLNIETRDARNDPRWNQELINEGGKYQVPCLRLVKEDGSKEWMYGSKNIIQYLDKQFG